MSEISSLKLRLPSVMLILCFLLLTVLSGCGTGPDTTSSPGSSSSSSGSTVSSSTISLNLSSSAVSYGTPITATATYRDANGSPVTNAVITFAASSNLVTFSPTSATALTNSSGVASVILNSASFDASGAVSITASASVTSGTSASTITSSPVGINVNGASVTIHSLTLGQSSISAYGSTSVSAVIWLNGSPATVPISVAFTSPCVASSKATLSTPVTTVSGTATSTYTDNNCSSATDVITASVTGGGTAQTTISVALPAINNIKFVSATPAIIGTQTSGAATLPKNSVVKFKVVDSNNNGKSGVLVDFSMVPASAPGGITLSTTSATSDANGDVTTTVTSGTIPTPVWVVASVHSTPSILTQSNTLTITTGLPTQNAFSLSVQTYNVEGWSYDNISSALTIIASDRLGNPVPDGTAINFISEGAQIQPASCTTTSGTCSTTFKSAEYRPANGRVTILAYSIGEKSFIDVNGNNSYDSGETFYDLGDLYVDSNENGQWDAGETYIVYSTSGSSVCLTQPGATALPSNYVNAPSRQNTCNAVWENTYVRRTAVLTLSGSTAFISPATASMSSTDKATVAFMLMDVNGNPMPAGTTIAVGTNALYYTPAGTTTSSLASVAVTAGSPVINTNAAGGTAFSLRIEGNYSAGTPVAYIHGTIYLNITTPKGLVTNIPITITP